MMSSECVTVSKMRRLRYPTSRTTWTRHRCGSSRPCSGRGLSSRSLSQPRCGLHRCAKRSYLPSKNWMRCGTNGMSVDGRSRRIAMIDRGRIHKGRRPESIGRRSRPGRWISSSRKNRKIPRGASTGTWVVENWGAGLGLVAGVCRITNHYLTNKHTSTPILDEIWGGIGQIICQIIVFYAAPGAWGRWGAGFNCSPMGGGALAALVIRAGF